MRFIAAIAGLLVSIPPLIFFWIGTQTFHRPMEKALAYAMTLETGALLLLSLALIFTLSVQRVQLVLLVITIVSVAAIFARHRVVG